MKLREMLVSAGLMVAMLALTTTMLTTQVLAEQVTPVNGEGLDDSGQSESTNEVMKPSRKDRVACAINAQKSDSWEAILWMDGVQKGDIVVYGSAAKLGAGSSDTLKRLNWAQSKGTKNATSGARTNVNKQQTTKDMPWETYEIVRQTTADIEILRREFLGPMVDAGQISAAERDKIVNQTKLLKEGKLTDEEIDAKLDSGEFVEWIMSFEPIHIVYWDFGTSVEGCIDVGSRKYDMPKRQEIYNKWKNGKWGNWIPFARPMSQPCPDDDFDAGFSGGKHDWKTRNTKKWAVTEGNATYKANFFDKDNKKIIIPSDNYVLTYAKLKGVPKKDPPPEIPPPTIPPTKVPTEGGFPPLHIFEYEMLAAIPTAWSKNSLGNAFGSDHEEHFIKEKTNTVPMILRLFKSKSRQI